MSSQKPPENRQVFGAPCFRVREPLNSGRPFSNVIHFRTCGLVRLCSFWWLPRVALGHENKECDRAKHNGLPCWTAIMNMKHFHIKFKRIVVVKKTLNMAPRTLIYRVLKLTGCNRKKDETGNEGCSQFLIWILVMRPSNIHCTIRPSVCPSVTSVAYKSRTKIWHSHCTCTAIFGRRSQESTTNRLELYAWNNSQCGISFVTVAVRLLVTSAKEVMYCSAFVCLSVCLTVSNFA